MKTAIGYKVLNKRPDGRLVSPYDGSEGGPCHKPWVLGKWETVEGDIQMCGNGFHCWEHRTGKFVKWTSLKSSSHICIVEFDNENVKRQLTNDYGEDSAKVVSKSMRILLAKPLNYNYLETDDVAIQAGIASFYE